MWQGVVRVASVGEPTDTVFMKRCLDSFYQALVLISDLQIVANLLRKDVISIHPAATNTDNSRFLFWSLHPCRCVLKSSNQNGMHLVVVWSDQSVGFSWDKNRKLLLVCKQWRLECACCDIVSFLIRQHFLIKGMAKSGTKEQCFFGFGQSLVKHRWASQLTSGHWPLHQLEASFF